MWVILFIQGLSANLYCSSSPCSSCIDKLLYKNVSCLDICPTGYLLTLGICKELESKLLFTLDFQGFSLFKAKSIGSFSNPNNYPFDDPSRSTPLPTLQMGFYFVQTSYLESSISWVPAPDFSVYMIARFNSTTGKVFKIMKESKEIFSIWLDTQLHVKWLLTSGSSESYYILSTNLSSDWMNLEFVSIQSNNFLTLKIYQISVPGKNMITFDNFEFRSQYDGLKYVIGDVATSFKGLISWISAENLEKSNYYQFYPIFTISEGIAMTSNNICSNKTCEWPWCVNDANCNPYASVNCASGDGYLQSECTSCSSGTLPDCKSMYQCSVFNISNCERCRDNFTNIDGFCLRNPTFYNNNNPTIPVIDAKFDVIAMNYGGVFISGSNEQTYAPFNNPESDDPWPAKNRGLYFNKGQFLTVKNGFNFNYKFTIAIWSYSESPSAILNNEAIYLRHDYLLRVVIRSSNYHYQAYNRKLLSGYLLKWVFYQFTFNQKGITSELKWYINMQFLEKLSIDGFIYGGTNSVVGTLDIGRWGNSSYWKGFIYRLTIWQTAMDDVSKYSKICGSTLSTECLWNCSGSKYYDPNLKTCLTCDPPCLNCSTFGTCNLCSDIKCQNCSSLNSKCKASLSNPCLPEFFLSSDNKCCQFPCETCFKSGNSSCLTCASNYSLYKQTCVNSCPLGYNSTNSICCQFPCETCFNSENTSCLTCAVNFSLYEQTCIKTCPSGFVSNDSKCIRFSVKFISLSLDIISNTIIDSVSKVIFTAGSNSSFYPALDSADPWPAKSRGFYFSSGKYLKSSPLIFEASLAFEFWVKVKSFGVIFCKDSFVFSAGDQTKIKVLGVVEMKSIKFPLNVWTQVLFAMENKENNEFFANLRIGDKVDKISVAGKRFNDSFSALYIGNQMDTFVGFLWSFQISIGFRDVFEKSFKICGGSLDIDCTWNCDILEYLDLKVCIHCNSKCIHGCRKSEDCNLCEDQLCLNCSSFYKGCSECVENAVMVNSECLCRQGFIQSKNKCTRKKFLAIFKVFEKSKIKLLFTEVLKKELENIDLKIFKNSTIQDYTIKMISPSYYQLHLSISRAKDLPGIYSLIFNTQLVSVNNSVLYPLNYSIKILNSKLDPVLSDIEEMESLSKSIANYCSIVVIVLSVISLDPRSLFTFLNTVEIFSYIILFHENFDPVLVAFLYNLRPSSIIPNPFEYIIPKSLGKKLGKKYKEFGIETNLLLLNAGIYYFYFCILIILLIFTLVTSILKHSYTLNLIQKLKRFLFFGAFLRLWIQSCLEVMIASILGIFEIYLIDSYNIFNFSLCLLTLILNYFCFLVLLRSVIKIGDLSSEEREEYKLKFITFFEEFKCTSTSNVLYYVFFVLRRYSLTFMIFFVKSSVIQFTVVFSFTFPIPFYILFKNPFNDILVGLSIVCMELLTCTYYILFILDAISTHGISLKVSTNIYIKIVIAAIFSNILFSTLISIKKIISFIKNRWFTKTTQVGSTKERAFSIIDKMNS